MSLNSHSSGEELMDGNRIPVLNRDRENAVTRLVLLGTVILDNLMATL